MNTIACNNFTLEFGKKTLIMGILNVTPDSFSDGGKFFNYDEAVTQGLKMVEDGAGIIDIGGESTRPFAPAVPLEEEIKRVIPVIEKLAANINVPISIDTTKASVAEKAIQAGASIINDISALKFDDKMAEIAVNYGCPVILMHMQGSPQTMQIKPKYDDIIEEIKIFFDEVLSNAEKKGIEKSKIIIDPGIGFGKTIKDNFFLINNLDKFLIFDVPILIGPSRKSFIRNTFKNMSKTEPSLLDIEIGTQAAISVSILKGASIVRVHDVKMALNTIRIIDSLKSY
ncbi:MAG: dihydropteroate synthase [Desulfobacterales bacterium]|nr:dihydropteroate synthase [Desulfobacterales bacterium]